MTILDKSKPIGVVMDRTGSDDEAQELVSDFTTRNKPVLDALVDVIGKAAAAGDADSLMLWRTTLRGLAGDVDAILLRDKVVVQPDQVRQ